MFQTEVSIVKWFEKVELQRVAEHQQCSLCHRHISVNMALAHSKIQCIHLSRSCLLMCSGNPSTNAYASPQSNAPLYKIDNLQISAKYISTQPFQFKCLIMNWSYATNGYKVKAMYRTPLIRPTPFLSSWLSCWNTVNVPNGQIYFSFH